MPFSAFREASNALILQEIVSQILKKNKDSSINSTFIFWSKKPLSPTSSTDYTVHQPKFESNFKCFVTPTGLQSLKGSNGKSVHAYKHHRAVRVSHTSLH